MFDSVFNQCFPPKPTFTEEDVPSQEGKVFMVTGGNSGVGFELCRILYMTGATIYMASRSEKRSLEAIQKIMESVPTPATPGRIKFLHLDLNDLNRVNYAALEFSTQESHLDVLWNIAENIPKFIKPLDRTMQDLEPMVGIHCVATLLFTRYLEFHLRAAAETSPPASARVVWTSDISADLIAPRDGMDFNLLDKGTANQGQNYAISKLGALMLSRELATRWGEHGIISVAMNPGNIKPYTCRGPSSMAMFLVKKIMYPDKLGAYTALYAGLSPDVTPDHNGAYIIPWGRFRCDSDSPRLDLIRAMAHEKDGGLGHCEKFWNWCERQWWPFI